MDTSSRIPFRLRKTSIGKRDAAGWVADLTAGVEFIGRCLIPRLYICEDCLRQPIPSRAWITVITLLMCTSAHAGLISKEEAATLEKISAAWQQRSEALKSVTIRYSTHHHDIHAEGIGEAEKTGGLRYQTESTLILDGAKYRCEISGKRPLTGKLIPYGLIATYDIRQARLLHAPDHKRNYHAGFIQSDFEFANWDNTPVLWCSRAADVKLTRLDLKHVVAVRNEDSKDGRSLIKLELRQDLPEMNSYMVDRLWLEADKFTIERWERATKDGVYSEGTSTYRELKPPTEGSTPISVIDEWTVVVLRPDGEPIFVHTNKVSEFVISPNVSPAMFRIEFPVGTIASDSTRKPLVPRLQTYDYLVLADGTERPITWEDRFTPYDKLLSKSVLEPKPILMSVFLWVQLFMGVLFVGIVWLGRRFRAKRGFPGKAKESSGGLPKE